MWPEPSQPGVGHLRRKGTLGLAQGQEQGINTLRQFISKRNLGPSPQREFFSSCPFSLCKNKVWSVISTAPKSMHCCTMSALERNVSGTQWGCWEHGAWLLSSTGPQVPASVPTLTKGTAQEMTIGTKWPPGHSLSSWGSHKETADTTQGRWAGCKHGQETRNTAYSSRQRGNSGHHKGEAQQKVSGDLVGANVTEGKETPHCRRVLGVQNGQISLMEE